LKVAILCNKVDWTERELLTLFNLRNHESHFFTIDDPEIFESDLVINRYTPTSVSSDKNFILVNYLEVIDKLKSLNIPVINGKNASICNLNKAASSVVMNIDMIRTPLTIVCNNPDSALLIAKEMLKFPFVKKPVMGSEGKDVKLVETQQQIQKENWSTDYALQPFLRSIETHDYQIYICDNTLLFGHRRKLTDSWLGSLQKGSEIESIDNSQIPIDVIAEAMRATKAINAWLNCCDIIMTKDGPYVIENNTTPTFTEVHEHCYGFNPVEVIVNKIEDRWLNFSDQAVSG
jgi:glutathione synthase/RimK-type ligase-like ATP-grasp enzyme